jgi:ABC-type phosphate transport system permease subunit
MDADIGGLIALGLLCLPYVVLTLIEAIEKIRGK